MKFTFKIEKLHKLEKSRVVILDGVLIDGVITTGSTAILNHQGINIGLKIKGVVIGGQKSLNPGSLSISVSLHEKAMQIVEVGDTLIGV